MASKSITLTWIVTQAARSFLNAKRNHRIELLPSIETGAVSVSAEAMPSDDVDVMRERAVRVGRMLADEVRRKRIHGLAPQRLPREGECAHLTDIQAGIALRVTMQYRAPIGAVLRFDMLGCRRGGQVKDKG